MVDRVEETKVNPLFFCEILAEWGRGKSITFFLLPNAASFLRFSC